MAFWLFLQSQSQLEIQYGRAQAQTIVDALGTEIYLAGTSLDTAERLSRRLGRKRPHSFLPKIKYQDGQLMNPDEIIGMRNNEALLIHGNKRPLKISSETIFQTLDVFTAFKNRARRFAVPESTPTRKPMTYTPDEIIPATLQREGMNTVQGRIRVLQEAWQYYTMAISHQRQLSTAGDHNLLRQVVDDQSVSEALVLVRKSLSYQAEKLHSELINSPELSRSQKALANKLIEKIQSISVSRSNAPSVKPSDSIYQKGFSDGLGGRTKSGRPALMKSVLSEAYRKKYHQTYNDGFYAGH